ncbi:MAG TPA: DUF1579 family protein [Candidatus Binatia bacterium]|nr:DUF1579 family protein [Candidatus Binatia bacterium]
MVRATRFAVPAAVVLLGLAAAIPFPPNAVAQEHKPPALPPPEMQRLAKLYAGTWTYTETYPKSPMFPSGAVNTGVYTSEPGPGGNSIFNHFHSKGPAGEFEGVIVMTWDPKEKAYKSFVFGDGFPGAIVETGQFEGEALVYRSEFSMGGKKMAMRSVTSFASDGKLTSAEYSSANGAPEALLVRVEAVKK